MGKNRQQRTNNMKPLTTASVLETNGSRPTMAALVKTRPGVGNVDLRSMRTKVPSVLTPGVLGGAETRW